MKDSKAKKKRKNYSTPKLTEYGSVRDLTKNMATGSFSDVGNKMSMA